MPRSWYCANLESVPPVHMHRGVHMHANALPPRPHDMISPSHTTHTQAYPGMLTGFWHHMVHAYGGDLLTASICTRNTGYRAIAGHACHARGCEARSAEIHSARKKRKSRTKPSQAHRCNRLGLLFATVFRVHKLPPKPGFGPSPSPAQQPISGNARKRFFIDREEAVADQIQI